MIKYYANLAKEYCGKLIAKWGYGMNTQKKTIMRIEKN